MKKLNRTTASTTNDRPVRVLQFGSGNFLRGFADWMIDILNEKTDFNASVQIVQSMSRGEGSDINTQDGLYHVVINGIQDGKKFEQTRLITCVNGSINPKENLPAYLAAAENPDLQFIISNTTESGIAFNQNDTLSDIPSATFPGKLAALLYYRFNHFNGSPDKGLIVLPCELIEKNGETLRKIILQYVDLWSLPQQFIEWVNLNCSFCNTLVDRIVPGFPKDTIDSIQHATGYEDKLVVMAEPFHLWVIQAPASVKTAFPADIVGLQVKYTNDLDAYRTRKVRILNGAHTTLVPVAYLKGFRTVRESVEDNEIGNFLHKAIYEEIIPTLDLPTDELTRFANDTIERFQNPFIRHELISIALNSISKFKVRVLPSILKYIETKKQMPERLLYSFACLIRFYKGEWNGEVIRLKDSPEVLTFFSEVWKTGNPDEAVRRTLANRDFWGTDLTEVMGLTEEVARQLKKLSNG